jgi:hypothetical protein
VRPGPRDGADVPHPRATFQRARDFAEAVNLTAVRDEDWPWIKVEDWTVQRGYVDEVLRVVAENEIESPIADDAPGDVQVGNALSLRDQVQIQTVKMPRGDRRAGVGDLRALRSRNMRWALTGF